MTRSWPTAEIDPVRRLRVMAAAVHAPMYVEEVLDAPFETVWAVASDLERELPRLVRAMRSFTILERRDETMTARAVSAVGHRAAFDVVLRPGWCLMQSRYVVGGMAAVPEGGKTRFAVLGASRAVSGTVFEPAGRNLGRSMLRRLRQSLPA
ncbi:MAG TPA: hypothetical protein VGP36_23380 [Mycobacteriales bacterium]|jgi:uncharacterized membrane protein|nr:hypothetical protein [Mycobacteriales bacterium]